MRSSTGTWTRIAFAHHRLSQTDHHRHFLPHLESPFLEVAVDHRIRRATRRRCGRSRCRPWGWKRSWDGDGVDLAHDGCWKRWRLVENSDCSQRRWFEGRRQGTRRRRQQARGFSVSGDFLETYGWRKIYCYFGIQHFMVYFKVLNN